MKSAVIFSIALHRVYSLVAFFIEESACLFEFIFSLSKIIIIDKVVACVIWRVDINHFYLTEISLTQYFEHIEVVALYVNILCVVKINTVLTARAESHCSRRISQTVCSTLVRPRKLITLFTFADNIIRQFCLKFLKVNSKLCLAVLSLSFCHTVRKQLRYLIYIRANNIFALHF